MPGKYTKEIDKVITLGAIARDAMKALIGVMNAIPKSEEVAFHKELDADPRSKELEKFFENLEATLDK